MNELELYVHIPFCVRKCAYCDFLSFPSKEDLRQEYVNALIREIRGYGKRYASCHVPTVFIGGGDTEWPDLEFRYCSRCQGYHCFCQDHIFNHVHFTE